MTAIGVYLLVGSKKIASLEVILRSLGDCTDGSVNINCVSGFIFLMHLDIFSWMEVAKLFVVECFPRISCPGPFVSDSPAPGVDGKNALSKKNGRGKNMHYHELGY